MAAVKSWFPSGTRCPARAGTLALVVALGLCGPCVSIVQAQESEPEVSVDTSVESYSSAAARQLSERLKAMHRFAGSFTQAIAGGRGQVLEQSTGYVLLDRPLFKKLRSLIL